MAPGRFCLLIACCALSAQTASGQDAVMSRQQIIAAGEQLADARLAERKGNYWGRFWQDGVMWAGYADLAGVSAKKEVYLKECVKMGERGRWDLILNKDEPNHADDLCIGQAFLYVYGQTKEAKTIAKLNERVDRAADAILHGEPARTAAQEKNRAWTKGMEWYWIDALFMAAPVFARLGADTGKPQCLEAMHAEWARCSDLLYDKQEHLWHRDARHLDRTARNGKGIFWSRGNGWVMGALARILPYIPSDDPRRAFYLGQFREMAERLASLQRPDGTWSPSLLDYEQFPYSETSGTALDCFAIAWGVNSGILDPAAYRPVVERAWAALLAARRDDGLLGYVQGVGAEPAKVYADGVQLYGTGAFLMAAAQVAEMAPVSLPAIPALTAAQPAKRR